MNVNLSHDAQLSELILLISYYLVKFEYQLIKKNKSFLTTELLKIWFCLSKSHPPYPFKM